ncbi:MAG: hypothetical protein JWQ95_2 [Sphaerisporangium sp.]|nr:hypothetical protein [Sphaerisporangium sp.]
MPGRPPERPRRDRHGRLNPPLSRAGRPIGDMGGWRPAVPGPTSSGSAAAAECGWVVAGSLPARSASQRRASSTGLWSTGESVGHQPAWRSAARNGRHESHAAPPMGPGGGRRSDAVQLPIEQPFRPRPHGSGRSPCWPGFLPDIDEVHPRRDHVAFTEEVDAQRGEQSLSSRVIGGRTREQALDAVGTSEVQ